MHTRGDPLDDASSLAESEPHSLLEAVLEAGSGSSAGGGARGSSLDATEGSSLLADEDLIGSDLSVGKDDECK